MAAYRRGRDELKVGLLALAALAVFVLLFGTLTSRGIIRHTSDLFILLPTAEGLLKGDAVLFRGVPVGEVRGLDFLDGRGVLVTAKLRREVPLTRDAEALLAPVDMFGRQSIVLREGPGTGGALADGDTLAGQRPERLADRIEGMGRQVDRFLADTTLTLFQQALAGIGGAGEQVRDMGVVAREVLESHQHNMTELSSAATTVARNLAVVSDSAELMALRRDLRLAIERLARASARMDSASASAASVFAKLDEGYGSLGRLVNDPALYGRTVGAVEALEQLAVDVRRNPGRYITLKVF